MIVAFTGHRTVDESVASVNITAMLCAFKPDRVIVGGAAGADTLAAEVCWLLKIPYEMALPHEEYAKHYGLWSSDRWQATFSRSAFVTYVVEDKPWHFSANFKRNEYMVDHCNVLGSISTFDPHGEIPAKGGTAQCVRYAQNRRLIEWVRT